MSRALTRWPALLGRRLLQMLALAGLVGSLCFVMMRALPGDAAMRIAASRYGYDLVGQAAAAEVARELGLDRPAWQALLAWWGDLARLDLGRSLVTGEPVWDELSHHLGATLQLTGAALAMALLLGLPLGLWAARQAGGLIDRLLLGLTVVLRGLPPFLIALGLMWGLAWWLGMLPVAGPQESQGWLLPALALALPLAAGLARVLQASLRQAMAMPSYEFARLKGLSDAHALWRHALPHALLPVLAYLGVQAVLLAEGAVVVETLFAWPGIGHALVHAVFARDVPVIQGAALLMGLLFVLFNLGVDGLCLWLDPRQRQGRRP